MRITGCIALCLALASVSHADEAGRARAVELINEGLGKRDAIALLDRLAREETLRLDDGDLFHVTFHRRKDLSVPAKRTLGSARRILVKEGKLALRNGHVVAVPGPAKRRFYLGLKVTAKAEGEDRVRLKGVELGTSRGRRKVLVGHLDTKGLFAIDLERDGGSPERIELRPKDEGEADSKADSDAATDSAEGRSKSRRARGKAGEETGEDESGKRGDAQAKGASRRGFGLGGRGRRAGGSGAGGSDSASRASAELDAAVASSGRDSSAADPSRGYRAAPGRGEASLSASRIPSSSEAQTGASRSGPASEGEPLQPSTTDPRIGRGSLTPGAANAGGPARAPTLSDTRPSSREPSAPSPRATPSAPSVNMGAGSPIVDSSRANTPSAGGARALSTSGSSGGTSSTSDGSASGGELRRGSRGPAVEILQEMLNAVLGAALSQNGVFDAATETALRTFQERLGLPATGAFDATTTQAVQALKSGAQEEGAKEEGVQPSEASQAPESESSSAKGGGDAGEWANEVRILQELTTRQRRQLDQGIGAGEEGSQGNVAQSLKDMLKQVGEELLGQVAGKLLEAILGGQGEASEGSATNAGGSAKGVEDQASSERGAQGAASAPAGPSLQRGEKSAEVRELQAQLNRHRTAAGLPKIAEDGDFGPETEAAVRTFQRGAGVNTSGSADAATRRGLSRSPTGSVRAGSLGQGAENDEVKILQRRLNDQRRASGQAPIAESGSFGPETSAALRAFQSASGLPATGRTDSDTVQALDSAASAPQQAQTSQAESPLSAPERSNASLRGVRVALDVGHGRTARPGFDPGAVNRMTGVTEFSLNSQVAEALARELRRRGATVTVLAYPLSSSQRLTLFQKGARARGHHLFLSLHHNAANRSAQGSEVLVHQSRTTASSRRLAAAVQRRMVQRIWDGATRYDRGVKGQRLGVLSGAHSVVQTAVLVEGFFLDPPGITTSRGAALARREALGIAEGIADYWASR